MADSIFITDGFPVRTAGLPDYYGLQRGCLRVITGEMPRYYGLEVPVKFGVLGILSG
jgi:hypothetical protein